MAVSFVLNGEGVRVDDFDPHVTLLEWLRERGHTAAKEGCAEGECGACAVALVKRRWDAKNWYEPVNGCLVLLASMDGQEIVTCEGVASPDGSLHAVQEVMLTGGSQCGYCTPGFVVSLFCEHHRPGRGGYDPESIAGNLCRCTGYRPIVLAAKRLGPPASNHPFEQRLTRGAPTITAVDHASNGHRFLRPMSLDAAIALAADPEAVLIAGGTDLVVYVNQRRQRFRTLVSLEGVPELHQFSIDPAGATIGAAVTLAEIEARLHRDHPGDLGALEQLFPLFSSRLIRNRATLGGNLATASPIGDSLPVLLALDATITIAGTNGTRTVAFADFFTGYRSTRLEPGEIVTTVRIARPFPAVQRFYKVSKRVLDDISTVAAAFSLDRTADGTVTRARLAYGGVAATPMRATEAERALEGRRLDDVVIANARDVLRSVGTPMDDFRGSAAYRREMIVRLFDKLVTELRP